MRQTFAATGHTWAYQELAVELLRKVATLCEAAGLPFLAVKGAVTSRLLYDDIAERPISDVDIRILPKDFWRWRKIASDWKTRCWNVAWTYRARAYDFAPLALDVESDIGPPGLCGLTIQTMLRRAETLEVAPGLGVLVPEIHDHAVVLTVNAFKDRFAVGNPWSVADLERIVRHANFRVEAFVERVVESRIVTVASIVASWLETHKTSEAWAAIRTALENNAERQRLYPTLYRWVAASRAGASLPAYVFMTLGGDTSPARVRACGTTVAWLAERRLRAWTGTRGIG